MNYWEYSTKIGNLWVSTGFIVIDHCPAPCKASSALLSCRYRETGSYWFWYPGKWLVIGDCRYPSWEFDTAVQLMYNRSSYKNDAYFLLSSMLPRYRSRCLKCRQSRRGRPIWVVARRTSLKCRQSRGRQTNSTWPLQDERVRTRLVRLYR
jgi:hypothetical protein